MSTVTELNDPHREHQYSYLDQDLAPLKEEEQSGEVKSVKQFNLFEWVGDKFCWLLKVIGIDVCGTVKMIVKII